MQRRFFSNKPTANISVDLVLSASMGYSGKEIQKTN